MLSLSIVTPKHFKSHKTIRFSHKFSPHPSYIGQINHSPKQRHVSSESGTNKGRSAFPKLIQFPSSHPCSFISIADIS